jgi:hypothetical protein
LTVFPCKLFIYEGKGQTHSDLEEAPVMKNGTAGTGTRFQVVPSSLIFFPAQFNQLLLRRPD